eukprot:gnl/Spiro4/1109_TR583_c0_g1_i1.p2 gnl/Spiro4/1109_TR583_c0_g1~~gnl/Spiro4/1109_TR583_c0_g1_i1.p2  ORF type:complete len:530 (+),score=169.64 gnl/Spiro4/1109_TR583_c0_g1_i1:132-1721(+)
MEPQVVNHAYGSSAESCSVRSSSIKSEPSVRLSSSPSIPRHNFGEDISAFKRFRKGRLLGQGAYGKVYQCMNEETGEIVAVKEIDVKGDDIQSELPNTELEERIKIFEHEVNLLKSLNHENIIRYLGTSSTCDTLSIYLEYAPYGSIKSLIASYGFLSEAVTKSFTRQLLLGLHYLHSNGIAHRDVKAANVLIVAQPTATSQGRVKLADFGASKQLDNILEVQVNSGMLSWKGTPYWMAPEVIKQVGYGRKSDVWSVGCTVVEMLTGDHAWQHVHFNNTLAAIFHIANREDSMPYVPESLSEEGQDFLRCCFRRNPKARPAVCELLNHPWIYDETIPIQLQMNEQSVIPLPSTCQFRSDDAYLDELELHVTTDPTGAGSATTPGASTTTPTSLSDPKLSADAPTSARSSGSGAGSLANADDNAECNRSVFANFISGIAAILTCSQCFEANQSQPSPPRKKAPELELPMHLPPVEIEMTTHPIPSASGRSLHPLSADAPLTQQMSVVRVPVFQSHFPTFGHEESFDMKKL